MKKGQPGPAAVGNSRSPGDGIILRPAARFPDAKLEDVAGCLRSKRKSKTEAQMHAAIAKEVTRRHDRGRY